jgi:hypothetical protein
MRVNAYILIGDPSFLSASVRSYYSHVDRIVVSYDRTGRSWTGTELPVEEALERVKALDVHGKCEFRPGDYARTSHTPIDNDTHQRSEALAHASEGADWVLQLDTDEVVPRADILLRSMRRADRVAATGVEFPARWLYSRVEQGKFLEACGRWWGSISSYPGPVAVKPGVTLLHARQSDADLYRADIRPWNTDPSHPRDAIVHEVVPSDAAVIHYSWVRSPEFIARKVGWSGHADTLRESKEFLHWQAAMQHPYLTVATAPIQRIGHRFRVSSAPDYPGEEK